MHAHAVSKGPEIPSHGAADLTFAFKEIILYKPLKIPLISGSAFVVLLPLRGITGDAWRLEPNDPDDDNYKKS